MVNLDSPFARTIIQAFDNRKINERIFCNESSRFEKRNEPPHEFGNIPNDVQALCAEFTGDMMSWFSTIHFLDPDQVSLACKKRLVVLEKKPTELSSYKDQLLQHIFNEIFERPGDHFQQLIPLLRAHYPTTTKIHFVFLRLCERVCFIAHRILGNEEFQRRLSLYKGVVFGYVFSRSILTYPDCKHLRLFIACMFFILIFFSLLQQLGNTSKAIHDFTKKTIEIKELQTAKTLWMHATTTLA